MARSKTANKHRRNASKKQCPRRAGRKTAARAKQCNNTLKGKCNVRNDPCLFWVNTRWKGSQKKVGCTRKSLFEKMRKLKQGHKVFSVSASRRLCTPSKSGRTCAAPPLKKLSKAIVNMYTKNQHSESRKSKQPKKLKQLKQPKKLKQFKQPRQHKKARNVKTSKQTRPKQALVKHVGQRAWTKPSTATSTRTKHPTPVVARQQSIRQQSARQDSDSDDTDDDDESVDEPVRSESFSRQQGSRYNPITIEDDTPRIKKEMSD